MAIDGKVSGVQFCANGEVRLVETWRRIAVQQDIQRWVGR